MRRSAQGMPHSVLMSGCLVACMSAQTRALLREHAASKAPSEFRIKSLVAQFLNSVVCASDGDEGALLAVLALDAALCLPTTAAPFPMMSLFVVAEFWSKSVVAGVCSRFGQVAFVVTSQGNGTTSRFASRPLVNL